MQHTLLGPVLFRKGMDLYFERHDGQAVTTDDFVQAMQDARGPDLTQYCRWHEHASWPGRGAQGKHDAAARPYALPLNQSCPPTPGQEANLPFHIPFALGLVGPDGKDMPVQLEGEEAVGDRPAGGLRGDQPAGGPQAGEGTRVVALTPPPPRFGSGKAAAPQAFVAAFARVLADAPRDPAFGAEALILPSEVYIAEQLAEVDPDAIHAVRNRLRRDLAQALRAELLATYHAQAVPGPYSPDARSAGKRALGNLCLGYLLELDDRASRDLAFAQFERADNMTDAMAALAALANCDCAERTQALDAFYAKWKHEPLVVDKWLGGGGGAGAPPAAGRGG